MAETTFKVDNWLIQETYNLFGARRAGQMFLPGMEPFGPFDLWATFALYSLLDPNNPTAAVETTPTELLETLEFAKTVSEALGGYATFTSEQYALIEEALHRLYSVEVNLEGFYSVKTGGRGRPSKQRVAYRGRILVEYAYIYPPEVTPPEHTRGKRVNVNRTKTTNGEPPPPIWKLADGPRPVGIMYRLSPRLTEGLQGGNIGKTIFPLQLFKLRPQLQPYPIATRLLVWISRQTKRTFSRTVDGLASEINVKGKDRRRTRKTLLDYLALLKDLGIVEDFAAVGDRVTITKAAAWHFPRGDKKLALGGDDDAEEGDDEATD